MTFVTFISALVVGPGVDPCPALSVFSVPCYYLWGRRTQSLHYCGWRETMELYWSLLGIWVAIRRSGGISGLCIVCSARRLLLPLTSPASSSLFSSESTHSDTLYPQAVRLTQSWPPCFQLGVRGHRKVSVTITVSEWWKHWKDRNIVRICLSFFSSAFCQFIHGFPPYRRYSPPPLAFVWGVTPSIL